MPEQLLKTEHSTASVHWYIYGMQGFPLTANFYHCLGAPSWLLATEHSLAEDWRAVQRGNRSAFGAALLSVLGLGAA